MIRCGVDIVFIPDAVAKFKDEAVLKRFFHAKELENSSHEHLAGLLAAKEAFFKALGMVPRFLDIQISNEPSGKPVLIAAPQWQTFRYSDLSISHDKDYAIAMVVIVTGEGNIPYLTP